MANIDTNSGNDAKKGKPQRKTLRVDFTPMVDMNMLLITFFMFCTTLSIPQVMNVVLPADTTETEPTKESKAITVLLGADSKVYYYEGLADYEDYTSLKETNSYGLRQVLLKRNVATVNKMNDLRQKRHQKQISDAQFKEQISEVKKNGKDVMVIIKPTKDSNFRNLVDVLDEMQICGVDKYAIVDPEDGDNFLMENLKTKGALTAMADTPK
ncbi:biopolymer transport protein ExbD [Dysgonomonas hofstadii]|uniref:Biopolymer transport protein ExbD n=1 Tax=Dysgonomonas hofstadii TaxID=637886 RepID=A0A840CWZ2_9BACT|nr:biopolymer transporter ExbD [Dysgonomonas hofstadii]MBB4036383.1 biopolymer transport protein ExbD [Dysgonomonas hofstadii]